MRARARTRARPREPYDRAPRSSLARPFSTPISRVKRELERDRTSERRFWLERRRRSLEERRDLSVGHQVRSALQVALAASARHAREERNDARANDGPGQAAPRRSPLFSSIVRRVNHDSLTWA